MKLKDLTENQVVQTTNENDLQFRELLDKEGFKWSSGESYLEWERFGKYDTTCYHVTRGEFCNKEYYQEKGLEILQASDFLTQKIKKSELKMEIDDLKDEVSNLRETLQYLIDETKKVTIVHPAEFVGDSTKHFKVIFGDTMQEVEQRIEADKPQFEVGTLGAFWDGDWDNAVDETSILTARLDKIVLGAYKPINRATCFQNFKPLKFD